MPHNMRTGFQQRRARKKRSEIPGFTLVEMIMVLVILGLLASIILPQFTQIHKEGSEVFVRGTLEGIAIAAETFAKKNNGQYPVSMTDLLNSVPPYITQNPCGTIAGGYTFMCTLGMGGYTIVATSVQNPSEEWTITTGYVLTKPGSFGSMEK